MKTLILLYLVITTGLSVFIFQDSTLEESMQRGSEIYADFCVTCHMAKGEGITNAFPPLANSDYLMKNREASISRY